MPEVVGKLGCDGEAQSALLQRVLLGANRAVERHGLVFRLLHLRSISWLATSCLGFGSGHGPSI